MENKNLKTSVFSLDTIFCESAELPIDIDFTLPDYYADISKILKCRSVPRISSKSISGNNILIDGCVTVTVIYCGNDNCISSYEYQYPFSKKFETDLNIDDTVVNAKVKCEYINCRAVTGRKIDIHGAVGLFVELVRRNLTEVISDCDDCNVEVLRGNVPATIPMGTAEKNLIIEEEIKIGEAQPDIRCVIRYDAEATITDTKIMAGKSMVKGELLIKLLYATSNNGAPQSVRCLLPFSQLIELDGVSESCDCESKVSISCLEIKPRVLATGECRQLSLMAKLLITSECCCNNDIAIIKDAYSRKYEALIQKNDVCIKKIIHNINQSVNCKKEFEFFDESISSVLDMWCEARTDSIKFFDNKMLLCGSVTAFIIANNESAIPVFYEKTIDFEYAYTMDTDGEFKCLPEITVKSANYTLTSEQRIEIRAELNICAAVYKCSRLPIITDIKIDDNKPVPNQNTSAMTLYFASGGEEIWNISKQYCASVQEIKKINDITEDVLTTDKMLLISTN